MDGDLITLTAANAAFVGSHFAMSHPLRAPLVRMLGEKGFSLAYTAVSFALLGWVAHAFAAAPGADLPGTGEPGWIFASALTWLAMVLLAGSFAGNPALPTPMAEAQARSQPKGVFRVTRHPMMWAIGLWALSHLVLFWSTRTMITAGAMGVLALLGSRLHDGKKARLMGAAWGEWSAKTSWAPRFGQLFSVGAMPLALGTAAWLAATWVHMWGTGFPVGLWKWVG